MTYLELVLELAETEAELQSDDRKLESIKKVCQRLNDKLDIILERIRVKKSKIA